MIEDASACLLREVCGDANAILFFGLFGRERKREVYMG